MATLFDFASPAKPAQCCDCKAQLAERHVTWKCRCNACDLALELRALVDQVVGSGDCRTISDAVNGVELALEAAKFFRPKRSAGRIPAGVVAAEG